MMFPALVCALLAAEPTGRVEGQVLHALTGEPVAKAVVTLRRNSSTPWGGARLTDATGRYFFDGIAPGSYSINASRPGFLANFQNSIGGRDDHSSFEVNGNRGAHSIPLRLHPAASLSGRVFDEDSEAMDAVSINVWRYYYYQGRPSWHRTQSTFTNAAGEFRIGDLAPGEYYLSADAEHRGKGNSEFPILIGDQEFNYLRTFFPASERVESARAFPLKAGENVTGVTFVMRRVPVFSVRGTFAGTSELADSSYVMVRRLPDGDFNAAGADAAPQTFPIDRRTGAFQLFGLSAGKYEVIATTNPPGSSKIVGHTVFTIGISPLDDLVVPVVSLASVSAKVELEESSATPLNVTPDGFYIQFRSATADEGPFVTGHSPSMGHQATLRDILPGKYSFSIRPISQKYYVKRIRLNGSPQTSNVVEIPPASASELEFLVSAKTAQLKGRVEFERGAGKPRATIVAEPANEFLLNDFNFRHLNCCREGQFESPGMTPGDYYLYAFEELDFSRSTDPAFLKRFRDRATKVTLGEEETKSVTLRAIPASEVLSAEQP